MRDSGDTGFLLVASQPVLLSCPVAELQEELVPGRGRLLILLSDLDTIAGRHFIEQRLGLSDFVILDDPEAADTLGRDWNLQGYPVGAGFEIKAPVGGSPGVPVSEAALIPNKADSESDWALMLGEQWSAALILRYRDGAFYVLDVLFHKLGRFNTDGELERLVDLDHDYWRQGEQAILPSEQVFIRSTLTQDPVLLNSILAPHSYSMELSDRGILVRSVRRYVVRQGGRVSLKDIAFFRLFDSDLKETDSFNAVPGPVAPASRRVGESFALALGQGLFITSSEPAIDDPDYAPSLILWEQFGSRIEPIEERRLQVLDPVFKSLHPASLFRMHASKVGRGCEVDSLWLFASYAAAGLVITSDSVYTLRMWQPNAHLKTSVKREGELIIPEIRYRNLGIKLAQRHVWCLEEKGLDPDRWLIKYSKSRRAVAQSIRLPEYLQQTVYLWLELSQGQLCVYGAEKDAGRLLIREWSP